MSREVVKVRTDREMYNAILNGNIAVLDSNEGLYRILEKVGNALNDGSKYNLKACKNITFSRNLILYVDGREKDRFSELYEFVDYYYKNEGKFNNAYLVFDFDEEKEKDKEIVRKFNEELFDTIQQLIYLDIHMDVYTKGFLMKKKLAEEFKKRHKEFENLVSKAIEEVYEVDVYDEETKRIKDKTLENLKKIEELLQELESEIKVAIFATKKTGKSMVVNCLVGEELAPTSQELPTPCNILFIPIKEDKIILHDENGKKEFTDAYELKKYLREKFKKVEEKGHKLPDIKIQYPYERYKAKKYKIYDTPGPDLVAEDLTMGHSEIYKTSLKDSDVAVFVIDYTKYAQESEVKLLENIKEEFKNRDMVLICAVNKIDQVFNDTDSEKMTIRIADFIRAKYKGLGFRNIIVIPISAMTYSYMYKLSNRFPELKELKGEDFAIALSNIKRTVKEISQTDKETGEYKTYVSFIQNIANNLDTFYSIDVSYESILNFSGVEFFEKYVEQVVASKAEVDRIYKVITEIGTSYNAIRNAVLNRLRFLEKKYYKIRKLNEEIKEFERKLEDIEDKFEELKDESYKVEYKLKYLTQNRLMGVFERAKKNSEEILERNVNKIRKEFVNKVSSIVSGEINKDEFVEKLKKELLKLYDNIYDSSKDVIVVHIKDGWIGLLDEIDSASKDISSKLEYLINEVNKEVQDLNRKFREIIYEEKPGEAVDESEELISIPDYKIDISFSELEELIEFMSMTIDYSPITDFTLSFKDRMEEITKGFINWLRILFFKERVISELYEAFLSEFDKLKNDIEENHENNARELEEILKKEIEHLTLKIERIFKDLRKMLREYFKSSFDTIKEMQNDARREEQEKERIMIVLNRMRGIVKPLEEMLEDIKTKVGGLESAG